jgi:predicted membrane channel-forming protein YqfA (hemolysin III family)
VARTPPNNPLKAPFFVVMGIVGLAVVAVGISSAGAGGWVCVPIGTFMLILSAASLRVIRKGQNPIWVRAPLDYWFQRRRQ